jgi:hypothetical protein
LSVRNLSKIAHIHPPTPPPRWRDGLIAQSRGKARRSEAGGPRPGLHHGLRRQRQRLALGADPVARSTGHLLDRVRQDRSGMGCGLPRYANSLGTRSTSMPQRCTSRARSTANRQHIRVAVTNCGRGQAPLDSAAMLDKAPIRTPLGAQLVACPPKHQARPRPTRRSIIPFVRCSPIKSSAEWEGAASEPCRVSNVR